MVPLTVHRGPVTFNAWQRGVPVNCREACQQTTPPPWPRDGEAMSPDDRARIKDEEMIRVLREVSRNQELLARMSAQHESAPRVTEGDDAAATDKVNSIAGFGFKQSLPVIKDTDPDLDRRIRECQSIINCRAFTAILKARKMNRLPQESRAVYAELIAKLNRTICETKMERQVRVEKTFESLTMGRPAHSAFRVE